MLITNQVVNWSYTSPFVRLDIAFGVAYGSDLRLVRRLAIEAAKETRAGPVLAGAGLSCDRIRR